MRELRFGTLREMLLRKRIPIFVVSFAVRGSVRGLPSPCCDFPAGIASDVEMEAPDFFEKHVALILRAAAKRYFCFILFLRWCSRRA